MLRFKASILVVEELDTVDDKGATIVREIDFPTTEAERTAIANDIDFHLSQVHVITDEGRVFTLRLSQLLLGD